MFNCVKLLSTTSFGYTQFGSLSDVCGITFERCYDQAKEHTVNILRGMPRALINLLLV